MFFCRNCNIITYDINAPEHIRCNTINIPYNDSDHVHDREKRIQKYLEGDTIYLNKLTAGEIVDVYNLIENKEGISDK